MNIALIISLILLIALVSVRAYEIKKQKETQFTHFVQRGDDFVVRTYAYLKKVFHSTIVFLTYIKHSFIERAWFSITHSVSFTKTKVDTLHNKLNGKGVIKKTDHVSFYLQAVSDHKDSIQKTRPEIE